MAERKLVLALAKVLIAAAWADGDLAHDEVNSMKDLLFFLPQISARQWSSLAIYIETPIGEEEDSQGEVQEACGKEGGVRGGAGDRAGSSAAGGADQGGPGRERDRPRQEPQAQRRDAAGGL